MEINVSVITDISGLHSLSVFSSAIIFISSKYSVQFIGFESFEDCPGFFNVIGSFSRSNRPKLLALVISLLADIEAGNSLGLSLTSPKRSITINHPKAVKQTTLSSEGHTAMPKILSRPCATMVYAAAFHSPKSHNNTVQSTP